MRFCGRLYAEPECREEFDLLNGPDRKGLTPGKDLELAPLGGGRLLEEGRELGDKEAVGDTEEEGRYEGLESREGLNGVLAAAVDGLGGEVEVVGKLIGCAEDGVDELAKIARREGRALRLSRGAPAPRGLSSGSRWGRQWV